MLWRIEIQANDGGGLFLKFRVFAGHVAFEPMWFEPGLCQYPLHGGLTQPQRRGQFQARPVSTAVDWVLLSASKNASLHGRCGRARLTPFVLPLQAGHAGLFKPSLPLRDRGVHSRPVSFQSLDNSAPQLRRESIVLETHHPQAVLATAPTVLIPIAVPN